MLTCNMPDHNIGPQHPWAFLSHVWSVDLGLGELSPGLLSPSNFSKCCVTPWVCSVCTLCCVGRFVWMQYPVFVGSVVFGLPCTSLIYSCLGVWWVPLVECIFEVASWLFMWWWCAHLVIFLCFVSEFSV